MKVLLFIVVVVAAGAALETPIDRFLGINLTKSFGASVALTSGEPSKLNFGLVYIKSYGFMGDLYEALKQKLSTDNVEASS